MWHKQIQCIAIITTQQQLRDKSICLDCKGYWVQIPASPRFKYNYSMRQKKLYINGPFNGETVPVQIPFKIRSNPVRASRSQRPVLVPVLTAVQTAVPRFIVKFYGGYKYRYVNVL